jgi:tetratricopeptide (TPR) repeat protein
MTKRASIWRKRGMAPSRPDIQYLMGMLDYTVKDMPAARKQFESVIASYPTHERSLLMLGQMQLQAKEYKEASATLEKAAAVDSKNWRAHYLLALASAHSGDLAKAGVEAARVGELNPEKAAAMRTLSARLLLMEGNADLAEEAFQSFIKSYPQDPAVPDVRKVHREDRRSKKGCRCCCGCLHPGSVRQQRIQKLRATRNLRKHGRHLTLTPESRRRRWV